MEVVNPIAIGTDLRQRVPSNIDGNERRGVIISENSHPTWLWAGCKSTTTQVTGKKSKSGQDDGLSTGQSIIKLHK